MGCRASSRTTSRMTVTRLLYLGTPTLHSYWG
jgi:hypothetical protein